MSTKHRAKLTAIITATTCWTALPAGVMAQNTLDRFLSSVEVTSADHCNRIDIRLHRPATYAGHTPVNGGTDVTIRLMPLGTDETPDVDTLRLRESADVPVGNAAHLNSVIYDIVSDGRPVIKLSFDHSVSFRVIMDAGTRHIRIDESESVDAAKCLGIAKSDGKTDAEASVAAKGDGQISGSDPIAEGKRALTDKDYGRAVNFFTKAVTEGSPNVKQEGQELLGLARERAGQLAHAKAEYETYLKLYPKGAAAARVRQRLAGVEAAEQSEAETQFAESNKGRLDTGQVPPKSDKPEDHNLASNAASKGDGTPPADLLRPQSKQPTKTNMAVPDPNAWTTDKSGSISQYYYRNDNFTQSDVLRGSLGTHEILQNELISAGDIYLHGENQTFDLSMRGAMLNETGFGQQSNVQDTNASTIYMDVKHKPTGLFTRVGRQSRSTGGIFGRFDGVNSGWEVNKDLKVQAVVGSPVFSRDAQPFASERIFYGASVDYILPNNAWATSLYAMEQNAGSVTDRRAIGAELRYSGKELFAYSAIDYDILFNEINSAYLSATWNFKEGAALYGTLDYRHVPFLLTSNALMGRSEQKLGTLVDLFGEDEVINWAMDRTASAKLATVGVSYPLNSIWTAAIDATIADYTGTPASGGVIETPNPGMEVYLSSQLTGTGVLTENDSLNFGLRYSGNDSSNLYLADASLRYPINEKLRFTPRLRVTYRDSKTSDSQQWLAMPSLGMRYRVNNHWNFEIEAGARWEDDIAPAGNSQNTEMLINAGYRYEF